MGHPMTQIVRGVQWLVRKVHTPMMMRSWNSPWRRWHLNMMKGRVWERRRHWGPPAGWSVLVMFRGMWRSRGHLGMRGPLCSQRGGGGCRGREGRRGRRRWQQLGRDVACVWGCIRWSYKMQVGQLRVMDSPSNCGLWQGGCKNCGKRWD